MVGTPRVLEEMSGHGEDWQVLDVWIVLGMIGYSVMHIMRVLPPTQTEAPEKRGANGPGDIVKRAVVTHAIVAGIMAKERQLLIMQLRLARDAEKEFHFDLQDELIPINCSSFFEVLRDNGYDDMVSTLLICYSQINYCALLR